jgi:hypothetical protein
MVNMNLTLEEYAEILKKTGELATFLLNGKITVEQGACFLSTWINNEELKHYKSEDTNLSYINGILFLIPKENGKAIRLIKAN